MDKQTKTKNMFKDNNKTIATRMGWLRFDLSTSPLRDNLPLSVDLILDLINKFYSEVFTGVNTQTILLQVRMDLGQGLTRSLTQFSKINYKDLDQYSQSVAVWYNFRNNHYHSIVYQNLYISYKILDRESTFISLYEEPKTSSASSLVNHSFTNSTIQNLMLPLTLDLWNWSEDILFNDSYTFASFIKGDLAYKINILKDSYKCTISSRIDERLLLSFQDHKLSSTSDLTTFRREYKDTALVYVNGEMASNESKLDNAYIKKLNKTSNLSDKFLTLDLETQGMSKGLRNPAIPGTVEQFLVSIGIYDGNISKSWYITDYLSPDAMVDHCLNYLLQSYNGYIIYVHNLSGFDVVYLLNSISKFGNDAEVILKDNKFISITIKVGNRRIILRDSLLILPSSLSKLGKSFNVGTKIEFDFNTFNNASLHDPSVRTNILDYNLSDCILLYNILNSFSSLLWDLFKVNIHQHPTLTSIAFSLYRSKFMSKSNIPVTSLSFYDHIKSGYNGGHVDVYRPRIGRGYYYDVNALYPTVMRNNPYPVGRGIYFTGQRELLGLFGIVYASIVAPKDLYAPILLTKTSKYETTAPLGTWKGWYFTGELVNAIKYGYQVTVQEGYHWDNKDYIFTKYVDTLYNLRLTFDKQDPKNLICGRPLAKRRERHKLLLNSLYGRFGLSPRMEEYSFSEELDKISKNLLVNKIELSEVDLFVIEFIKIKI